MVSNHGGRQLDGVEATIDALPAIVKGGLISESFSLWLKSQKKVTNHYPEHLLSK